MSKIPEVKSLRWLANNFPFTENPKDEVDRMTNAIHVYCSAGADKIEELAKSLEDDWIPVEERLPEIAGHEVLATIENLFGQRRVMIIFTGYSLSKQEPFWYCNHKEIDLDFWKVVAWKELPRVY